MKRLLIIVLAAFLLSAQTVCLAGYDYDYDYAYDYGYDDAPETDAPEVTVSEAIPLAVLFFVAGGGIVTAIVMVIEYKKHRPVRMAANADIYIESGGVERSEDSFLRTHTTRVKIRSSSSGSSKRR